MLVEEIINNWQGSPSGIAMKIQSLEESGYVSWTIKTSSEYGVAIPIAYDEEISEFFSGAHYYTRNIILKETEERHALLLTTNKEEIKEQFAALCAELLNPGENGELRKEIINNPASWWIQWKELLGNKNVDLRVYDVLGELWVLKHLAASGEAAEWGGPNGATYDIDCDEYFAEVKSTVARKKRQITLSNLFQLDPPEGKELFLYLCQFETAQSGISIDSLVKELEQLGYNALDLNTKLEKLGLEKGKTARRRNYMLHAVTKYKVDEKFPAIRDNSFKGDMCPAGVISITYTVSLDGIKGENILKGNE